MRVGGPRRACASTCDAVRTHLAQVLGDMGGLERVANRRVAAVRRATAYWFGPGKAHPSSTARLRAHCTPQHSALSARAVGEGSGRFGEPPLPKLGDGA